MAAKGGTYLGVALLPTDGSEGGTAAPRPARLPRRALQLHEPPEARSQRSTMSWRWPRGLADVGWHLQIHMEGAFIADLGARLASSPVPVVIDHIGRVDASLGARPRRFPSAAAADGEPEVLGEGQRLRPHHAAGPPYADAIPFARTLVEKFPDRVVWGTDWPHPNHQGPVPDDGQLVDIIAEIAPTRPRAPQADGRQSAPPLRREGGVMSRRLAGKIALISGAGSVGPGWGNGRAMAVRFAEEGASIFAVDREPERLEETIARVRQAGAEIETHIADVTDGAGSSRLGQGLRRTLRPHRHSRQQRRRLGGGRPRRNERGGLGRAGR